MALQKRADALGTEVSAVAAQVIRISEKRDVRSELEAASDDAAVAADMGAIPVGRLRGWKDRIRVVGDARLAGAVAAAAL